MQSRTTPRNKPRSSADRLASCRPVRQLQQAAHLLDDIRTSRRLMAPEPRLPSLQPATAQTSSSRRRVRPGRPSLYLSSSRSRSCCSMRRGARWRCRSPRICTSQTCSVRLPPSRDAMLVRKRSRPNCADHICKRISPIPPPHPRDCALVVRLSDGDIVAPLDRTVASLGEHHTLVLVPRSQVGAVGLRRRDARSADPSGSSRRVTLPSCFGSSSPLT